MIALVLGIAIAYFIEDYMANKTVPARPKSLTNICIIFTVVFGLVYVGLTHCESSSETSVMKNMDVGEPDW